MSLTLHFHPLASACWKVLVALYENDTPFRGNIVDLSDPVARAELAKLWPLVKFPVLVDDARGSVVPETSIIIDYLDRYHPGKARFIPDDPDAARQARLADRVYDFYVHDPMQKIVADRLRPEGTKDHHGVEQQKALIEQAYSMLDRDMAKRRWAAGDEFTIADCAACPALYYANRVTPIGDAHPHLAEYLKRLTERPSFARVLREAKPYFHMFPR